MYGDEAPMVEQRLNLPVLAGCGNLTHDGVIGRGQLSDRLAFLPGVGDPSHGATSSSVRCLHPVRVGNRRRAIPGRPPLGLRHVEFIEKRREIDLARHPIEGLDRRDRRQRL